MSVCELRLVRMQPNIKLKVRICFDDSALCYYFRKSDDSSLLNYSVEEQPELRWDMHSMKWSHFSETFAQIHDQLTFIPNAC